jgi:hypothetical protein
LPTVFGVPTATDGSPSRLKLDAPGGGVVANPEAVTVWPESKE